MFLAHFKNIIQNIYFAFVKIFIYEFMSLEKQRQRLSTSFTNAYGRQDHQPHLLEWLKYVLLFSYMTSSSR